MRRRRRRQQNGCACVAACIGSICFLTTCVLNCANLSIPSVRPTRNTLLRSHVLADTNITTKRVTWWLYYMHRWCCKVVVIPRSIRHVDDMCGVGRKGLENLHQQVHICAWTSNRKFSGQPRSKQRFTCSYTVHKSCAKVRLTRFINHLLQF